MSDDDTSQRHYILEWRTFRDMTQEQLAAKADIGPSNISMYETFDRSPGLSTLIKLAKALETDIDSLLHRSPADSYDLWSTWDRANPEQRRIISEHAKIVVPKARS